MDGNGLGLLDGSILCMANQHEQGKHAWSGEAIEPLSRKDADMERWVLFKTSINLNPIHKLLKMGTNPEIKSKSGI